MNAAERLGADAAMPDSSRQRWNPHSEAGYGLARRTGRVNVESMEMGGSRRKMCTIRVLAYPYVT